MKNCTIWLLIISWLPTLETPSYIKPWPSMAVFSPQFLVKTWVRYFWSILHILPIKDMSHLTFKWTVGVLQFAARPQGCGVVLHVRGSSNLRLPPLKQPSFKEWNSFPPTALPNHLNMLKLSPFFSKSSKTFETKNAFGNSKLPNKNTSNLGIYFGLFWMAFDQENCNTPPEHTPGNPPSQLWKESLYSL